MTAWTTHSVSIRLQPAFIIRPREQREREVIHAGPDQLRLLSPHRHYIRSDHGKPLQLQHDDTVLSLNDADQF